MRSLYETARERLLQLGSRNPVLRSALRLQARSSGFRVSSSATEIILSKANRKMLLPISHYPELPSAVHMWDLLFDTVDADVQGSTSVLNFSTPGIHRHRSTGVSFWSPGMVEEDSMSAYTAAYRPKEGDVVWDIGAHAGATTYFLAQMVGPTGTVYAFEPDDLSYEYLLRNITMHKLTNVVPIKKALAGTSGAASFSMDGTLGAGLIGFTQCVDRQHVRQVETVSFGDACIQFGTPDYVKMDIEGAEVDVIASALSFLKEHPVRFAIETEHRVNREYTSVPITRMLSEIGYTVWSAVSSGQQFTWAHLG